MLARVPDPLRLVAVDGWGTGRERGEIECDDGERAHIAVVAEDRDRELRPRQIGLDEYGLLIALYEERHAPRELRGRLTQVIDEYALTRSLRDRHYDRR